jgi:hypothetical protein
MGFLKINLSHFIQGCQSISTHTFHTFLLISVKFSMGDINIMLLGNFEFYENRCSESHMLLKVVNVIFPIFSIFFT